MPAHSGDSVLPMASIGVIMAGIDHRETTDTSGGRTMMRKTLGAVALAAAATMMSGGAGAEILALVNYESKTADSLKALKITAPTARRDGLMVLDVDPASPRFGAIILDIPLPSDLVSHHIFYDRTMTKAYITALGKPELRTIDMQRFPYRVETIAVPPCQVLEDVIFSGDNRTWYLTCMGSNKVVVGSVATDDILSVIETAKPYPHGLAINQGIDRFLVSSTVRASDLGDAGETISVYQASTGWRSAISRSRTSPRPRARPRSRSCSRRGPTRRWPTSPTCTAVRCGPRAGTPRPRTSTSPRRSRSPTSAPGCHSRCTSTTPATAST